MAGVSPQADWYTWDTLPSNLRTTLTSFMRDNNAAVRKSALLLVTNFPKGCKLKKWHSVCSPALWKTLTGAFRAETLLYDIEGKTIRVWYDKVGITL